MKKFAQYIFIAIVLIGLFSSAVEVQAQAVSGSCVYKTDDAFGHKKGEQVLPALTQEQCGLNTQYEWVASDGTGTVPPITAYQDCINKGGTPQGCSGVSGTPKNNDQSAFEIAVESNSCGFIAVTGGTFQGCILQFIYWTFYTIGGWLLYLAAHFFNFLIGFTLGSEFLKADFVSAAWGVVRDLSNIFFILILLYISIKVILNMGGHGVKEMIARVIIMALLINFSMFFTKIVIDTSNIIALVFYNKISTTTKNNTSKIVYDETGQKDIAGGLTSSFNPVNKLDDNFFKNAGNITTPQGVVQNPPSTGILIGITLIAGSIMLFAAYALFVSGMSFLGRLIELFVLIIFAPFAFMSSSVPILEHIQYLGWSAWSSRLLKVSFMAPIFMFFLYFIFLLLGAPLFTDAIKGTGVVSTLLGLIIPALVVLVLLLKATEFAKKGSGQFGEAVVTGAKVIGGLAVGGAALATGGAALVGRQVAGRTAAWASQSTDATHYGKARSEWELHGRQGKFDDHLRQYETRNNVAVNRGFKTTVGGRINAGQLKSGEINHARHEMDDLKKKLGLDGINDSRLSGVEIANMKGRFIKDNRSGIEADIRKGYDARGGEIKIERDINGNQINAIGESDYKAKRRQDVMQEVGANQNNIDARSGELTDQARKQVEDKLNTEFTRILQNLAPSIGENKYKHLQDEAKQAIGLGSRIAARSTSGTYDARNIGNVATDRREFGGLGVLTSGSAALVTKVAAGVRLGLKKSTGVDYGTPKGNFFKDIAPVITDALKNMKLNKKLEGGGGDHGHGGGNSPAAHAPDHGGGDHGHGGGGHH